MLDFGAGDKLTFEGATANNVHFDVADNGRDLVVTVIGQDNATANKVTIKNGARDVHVDDHGNVQVGSGYNVTETHHDGATAVVIDNSHHGVPS